MQKQTQILKKLYLHHHKTKLAWLIQEYLFLVKSNHRTNTENSVEVGLFVPSFQFTLLVFLFKFKVIADQLFKLL